MPSVEGHDLRERLQWFLLGRVSIISAFLGVLALLYLGAGRDAYAVSVPRLLFVIAVTYAFSAASALALPRLRRLVEFTYAQIAYDVGLVTGVIYLTGGTVSPFGFLYSLPVINAAGLLFAPGAFAAAGMAAGGYAALTLALVQGWLRPVHGVAVSFDHEVLSRLWLNGLTPFLIAFLASILTRRLSRVQRLLEEREAERDRLAAIQDTLARTIETGLITTDPEGRVTSANEVAAGIAGVATWELVGMFVGDVFPHLRVPASGRVRFLQSPDASAPVEFFWSGNDGGRKYLRARATPLRDTYGHLMGGLYILQDITRFQELEEEVKAGRGEAEEAGASWVREFEVAEDIAARRDGLYGESEAMRRVRTLIDRVARSDATVLICGESGTGKELVARAIHARSARRDRPLVAINCGAIPESLIESELFGHVRGAFTGAVADRPGCFRAADGGTLFLDEIGELPLATQVKLLRVLQERVFRPVGSETTVAVDVRIIAATNRDLRVEMEAGRFREDLYYRLNVITIDLPPLRERRQDIPLLARHFLRQFSALHGRSVNRFSVGAARLLLDHQYPGNVRELENIVEHAVALCEGETATEEHLPAYLRERSQGGEAQAATPSRLREAAARAGNGAQEIERGFNLEEDLAEYEKALLMAALRQAGGVKKRAAEILGINYRSFRHRLQKYGMSGGVDSDQQHHADQASRP